MRFYTLLASMIFLGTPALAYIGPGAGAGAIGVLIAIIGGIVLLLIGFLWFPIKRMMRKNKGPEVTETDATKE